MASRHNIIVINPTTGQPVSGKYVYVYKQGLYVNATDRVQAVDTDNNGIYWFDTENANLQDGLTPPLSLGVYDIGIYDSSPGAGDHTSAYTAQKKDEREYKYYGSHLTLVVLRAHIINVANPHDVTITQAIAEDGTASASLTTPNLNILVNGGATALHTHTGVAPSAHHTTHERSGDDKIAVTNDMIPEHNVSFALEAGKIHLLDTLGNFAEDDVEGALVELFPTLATPTGVVGTGTEIPAFNGVKVLIVASWNAVAGADTYIVECKPVSGVVSQKVVQGLQTEFLMSGVASYQLKVKAKYRLAYSNWTDYVNVSYTTASGCPDYSALKALYDEVLSARYGKATLLGLTSDIYDRVNHIIDMNGSLTLEAIKQAQITANLVTYSAYHSDNYIEVPNTDWVQVGERVKRWKPGCFTNLRVMVHLVSKVNGVMVYFRVSIKAGAEQRTLDPVLFTSLALETQPCLLGILAITCFGAAEVELWCEAKTAVGINGGGEAAITDLIELDFTNY